MTGRRSLLKSSSAGSRSSVLSLRRLSRYSTNTLRSGTVVRAPLVIAVRLGRLSNSATALDAGPKASRARKIPPAKQASEINRMCRALIAQIAVGNPIRAALPRRVSRQPVALFPLFVPLSVSGVKDQEVVIGL